MENYIADHRVYLFYSRNSIMLSSLCFSVLISNYTHNRIKVCFLFWKFKPKLNFFNKLFEYFVGITSFLFRSVFSHFQQYPKPELTNEYRKFCIVTSYLIRRKIWHTLYVLILYKSWRWRNSCRFCTWHSGLLQNLQKQTETGLKISPNYKEQLLCEEGSYGPTGR